MVMTNDKGTIMHPRTERIQAYHLIGTIQEASNAGKGLETTSLMQLQSLESSH